MRSRLVAVVAGFLSLVAAAAQAGEYDLVLDERLVDMTGRPVSKLTINGSLPGPTLRFKEGEDVVIRVTNRLDEPSSIHWHGLLLPDGMDGVPGLGGFSEIQPGATFTYRFTVRQHGTYWYHSHSKSQEQDGLYGAIVVEPAGADPYATAREHVVVLSDFTEEDPDTILRNLKVDAGYYNYGRRTLGDFLRLTRERGLAAAVRDRSQWGAMRMDPTDLADVSGYTFLVNGVPPSGNWTGLFTPGERVRLRVVNASAMTFYDVRIPGLKLIVVQADGRNVAPVPVDEFRIGPAETYDVIVTPQDRAYTLFAESIDRSGHARGTLAPHEGMTAEIPAPRPRTILTMADMGEAHAGHDMSDDEASAADPHAGHDMAADPHAGHNMAADPHAGHGARGDGDKSGGAPSTAVGWADRAASPGTRVLSYADLRSLAPQDDTREPERTIEVRLGGNMERYIWTIDGRQGHEARPVALRYGERVRLTFVNETMMAHPMHLHGMFVQLENGQPASRLPDKHTVVVEPGQSYSVLLTADEVGEWAFHCHLMFHMEAGMMTKAVVARMDDHGSSMGGGS